MNIELEYFINNNIRLPMYSKFMLLQNIQKISINGFQKSNCKIYFI